MTSICLQQKLCTNDKNALDIALKMSNPEKYKIKQITFKLSDIYESIHLYLNFPNRIINTTKSYSSISCQAHKYTEYI